MFRKSMFWLLVLGMFITNPAVAQQRAFQGVKGIKQIKVPARQALYKYADAGDVQSLLRLTLEDIDIETLDAKGQTPLCEAVWKGNKKAVAALVEVGASQTSYCMSKIPESYKTAVGLKQLTPPMPRMPMTAPKAVASGVATTTTTAATATGLSTGAMVAIGVGAAALVGGGVALAAGGGGGSSKNDSSDSPGDGNEGENTGGNPGDGNEGGNTGGGSGDENEGGNTGGDDWDNIISPPTENSPGSGLVFVDAKDTGYRQYTLSGGEYGVFSLAACEDEKCKQDIDEKKSALVSAYVKSELDFRENFDDYADLTDWASNEDEEEEEEEDDNNNEAAYDTAVFFPNVILFGEADKKTKLVIPSNVKFTSPRPNISYDPTTGVVDPEIVVDFYLQGWMGVIELGPMADVYNEGIIENRYSGIVLREHGYGDVYSVGGFGNDIVNNGTISSIMGPAVRMGLASAYNDTYIGEDGSYYHPPYKPDLPISHFWNKKKGEISSEGGDTIELYPHTEGQNDGIIKSASYDSYIQEQHSVWDFYPAALSIIGTDNYSSRFVNNGIIETDASDFPEEQLSAILQDAFNTLSPLNKRSTNSTVYLDGNVEFINNKNGKIIFTGNGKNAAGSVVDMGYSGDFPGRIPMYAIQKKGPTFYNHGLIEMNDSVVYYISDALLQRLRLDASNAANDVETIVYQALGTRNSGYIGAAVTATGEESKFYNTGTISLNNVAVYDVDYSLDAKGKIVFSYVKREDIASSSVTGDKLLSGTPFIHLMEGAQLITSGVLNSDASIDFALFSPDGTGKVVALPGAGFVSEGAILNDLHLSSEFVTNNFDKIVVAKDMFQANDTTGLNLISDSHLFNASLADNGKDVLMTMKSFDDVTDNKSLAAFLEANYAAGNNEAFFNDIKSIGNATAFTSAMDDLTGRDTISKFTHEDLTAMREVNFAMNEMMFANNDKPMFEANGTINSFSFKNDNASSAQYALANKRISPRMKIGYAMSTTNLNTDDDNDTTRRNSVFQVFAPVSYDRAGWQMIATPQIGFARGHYTRKGYNGTSYDGTIEKRIIALMNEARYPMTVGDFEVSPTVELNAIAYNTKGSEDEKAYSLTMPSDNNISVEAGLGFHAGRSVGDLKFKAGLMMYKEFAEPYNIKMGMNGMDGTFDLYEDQSDYRGVASFGFGYNVGDLNVYGDVQHFIETDTHTKVKAGLKWTF